MAIRPTVQRRGAPSTRFGLRKICQSMQRLRGMGLPQPKCDDQVASPAHQSYTLLNPLPSDYRSRRDPEPSRQAQLRPRQATPPIHIPRHIPPGRLPPGPGLTPGPTPGPTPWTNSLDQLPGPSRRNLRCPIRLPAGAERLSKAPIGASKRHVRSVPASRKGPYQGPIPDSFDNAPLQFRASWPI